MSHYSNFSSGPVPRIAFFTDSFHQANGVALTSRQFAAFAKSRFHPFFSVHPGERTAHWKRGNFETFELADSRFHLNLESDLAFDLGFARHRKVLRKALSTFQPDLIHVTGPGHVGLLGALLAHDLRVPLAASWHTNVHEFGARRLSQLAPWLPAGIAGQAEKIALDLALRFYRLAKVLFAPNPEVAAMLSSRTGKPVHLMQQGIPRVTASAIQSVVNAQDGPAAQDEFGRQWSAVFEQVYRDYGRAYQDGTLPTPGIQKTFLTVPVS